MIQSARKALGYSQEYMAYRIGMSIKTYARKENEPSKFWFNELKDVCRLLDLDENEVSEWIFSTLND